MFSADLLLLDFSGYWCQKGGFGTSFWRLVGTPDSILVFCQGLGNGLEFGWILGPPWDIPGTRSHAPESGKLSIRGGTVAS